MSLLTFIHSDWATKKQKLRKWWHRNDWKNAHSPSLTIRIKTEWDYQTHKNECLIVDGWLVKFYETKESYMNWGDDINVYMLERMTGKKVVPAEKLLFRDLHSKYTVIGSVIPNCINKKTIIWGSGCMDYDAILVRRNRPIKDNVKAVRGPKTREYLTSQGVACPEIYGDPAMLLPKIYQPKSNEKKYKISIIPHHRDWDDSRALMQYVGPLKDVHVINMISYDNWTDIIDEIIQSEIILSSSLHGIIVSDAYGIPNRFVEFLYHHPKYDKYEDYYAYAQREFVQPLPYAEATSQLSKILSEYKRPMIDIQPLIDACPFDINIS